MQIKIFSIPVFGGEAITEDLNAFLRSKKIVQVEQKLIQDGQGTAWSFCIRYTEDYSPFNRIKEKVDYKEILDEAAFQRFTRFKEIRRKIAKEESLPAYAVFTDEELAEIAKPKVSSLADLQAIKGIGTKKVEKYGHHFVKTIEHEQG